jgi:hypothetical protein
MLVEWSIDEIIITRDGRKQTNQRRVRESSETWAE